MPTPYRLCYAEEPEDHILEILMPNINYSIYKSDNPIVFSSKIKMGSCRKMVFKYKRLYSFLVSSMGGKDIKLYGYRKTLFGFQTKMIYYCMEDHFIMGEYIFLSYSQERVQQIADDLFKLYEVNDKYKSGNFYIENKDGSRLFFFDSGFEINIRYFFPISKEILEVLNQYFNPTPTEQG